MSISVRKKSITTEVLWPFSLTIKILTLGPLVYEKCDLVIHVNTNANKKFYQNISYS